MAYLHAITLSVIARSQQNTERPFDIGCRKYSLVVLLPDEARSVTAIVTKAITVIWRYMRCSNSGTHLMHCMEADNHSNGIDSIPCHPTHSKRPYNTAALGTYIYRHAAGENEQSAAATQLLSTAWKSKLLRKFCVLLAVHLDILGSRKTNLIYIFFLVYFVNLYRFRACLGPSSGGKTVCIQQLVIIVLFVRLPVVLNPSRTTDSHLKRAIGTNCCTHTVVPPDDGLRHARNM